MDKLCSILASTRCKMVGVKSKLTDLRTLGEWLSSGLVVRVERTIPLAEAPRTLERLARGELQQRVAVEMDAV